MVWIIGIYWYYTVLLKLCYGSYRGGESSRGMVVKEK